MRFYRPRGHDQPAVLWDPTTNSTKYEFVGGVLETDDQALIGLLQEMGFQSEPMGAAEQAALEIAKDRTREQPPPPPRKVPAIEPKGKGKG